MSKRIKKVIALATIVIIVIIAIIATYFIARIHRNKENIEYVLKNYTEDTVQYRLNNEDAITTDDLLLKVDGKTTLGVIRINKIGFEGLIYEGTSNNILQKGIGHYEHSPYLNGNVCLAGYRNSFKNFDTLESGDLITYISFLGKKQYKVNKLIHIKETDWSLLESSDKNILTLVTFTKGKASERICIQATEVR